MIDRYTLFQAFITGYWVARIIHEGPTVWRIIGLGLGLVLVLVDLNATTPRKAVRI